jgi:hypothetical protein
MRREYDFSKGVRGKFYRKYVELRLPIIGRRENRDELILKIELTTYYERK